MGVTLRKLVSIYFLRYTSIATSALIEGEDVPFNRSHFRQLQYGLESLGTDKIIHSLRTRHELHPEEDMFAPDAENAFNLASRTEGLGEALKHFPGMLPFLSRIYAHDANGWIKGDAEIHNIVSAEAIIKETA
jgi:hypothetical protein